MIYSTCFGRKVFLSGFFGSDTVLHIAEVWGLGVALTLLINDRGDKMTGNFLIAAIHVYKFGLTAKS